MKWTDELKKEVAARYTARMNEYATAQEKSAMSMSVCTEIANSLGVSANGVRLVLTDMQVYISKTAATAAAKAETPAKSGRGSKQVALSALKEAIANIDPDLVNEELIDKLSGLQATYILQIINKVT